MASNQFLTALVLAIGFLAGANAQDSIGCFVPGECVGSTFISISQQPDSGECLNACKDTTGCNYFTYYENEKACFFFIACNNLNDDNCVGCISGDSECTEEQCNLQGLCDGKFVNFELTATRDLCITECKETALCGWWSYNDVTKYCVLSEDCAFLDSSDRYNTTVAGEKACEVFVPPPPAETVYDTILAIGGYSDGVRLSSVEILNLGNDTCMPSPAYPVDIEEMYAFEINGTATVCGGYGQNGGSGSAISYNECRQLNDMNEWEVFTLMTTERCRHTGITWNDDSIWITGGRDDTRDVLASTEIYDGVAFAPASDLPEPLEFHCLVQVSDNNAMLVGGYNLANSHSRKAFLYDKDLDSWEELQSMVDGRNGHTCELVESESRGTELIVAGGGLNRQSVDVFSFTSQSWRSGTPLPQPTSWASSVPYGSTFLLLGGGNGAGTYYDSVYEYNVEPETWSLRTDLALETARFDLGTVLVPSERLDCTEDASP